MVRTTIRTCPLPIRERKIFVSKSTIRTRFRHRSPRPHLVFSGLFGSTDLPTSSPSVDIRKEPLIARVNTDNHRVKRVTRYPRPVFLGSLKQLRQMWLQAITSEILSILTVIALFKRQDVSLQVSKIVKHIPQAFGLRMRAYRIFIGAHWRSYRYRVLNPCEVGGRHVTRGVTLRMPANTVLIVYYI